MRTISQEKIGQKAPELFDTLARKRMIDLKLTIRALSEQLGVHRNSTSLAIRHPAVLPDLHRRVAATLSIKPVV